MVEMIPGFEVFEVAEDRAWGVWTNEFGVETVRVYEIHRSNGRRNDVAPTSTERGRQS